MEGALFCYGGNHKKIDEYSPRIQRGEDSIFGAIDFGCLGVGDSACDVMAAWLYISAETCGLFRYYVSVEHEPDNFDPTADCIKNLRMLRDWLG